MSTFHSRRIVQGAAFASSRAGDVGESIFGREGVEPAISEAGQQVRLDDGFRSSQVKPLLDSHRLPVQREEVLEGRGCDRAEDGWKLRFC